MIGVYDRVSVYRELAGSTFEWRVFLAAGLLGITTRVQKFKDERPTNDNWVLEKGESEFLTALLNRDQVSVEEMLELFPGNDESGLDYLLEEINTVFGEGFVVKQDGVFSINETVSFDFPAGITADPRTDQVSDTETLAEQLRHLNHPGRHTLQ